MEDMLDYARRFFSDECDNLTALLFRWDDEPTRHQPLFNLGTPELDQEKLWHTSSGTRAPRPADAPARIRRRSENLDSVIAEIESFVNNLDSADKLGRGKDKTD